MIIGKNGLDKCPLSGKSVEFCRRAFEGTKRTKGHKEEGGIQTEKKDHRAYSPPKWKEVIMGLL